AGQPTVADMPNLVAVFSPWNTHSSAPASLRTTLGASAAHFAGTWFLNMFGGSIMWSSMLTRIMSSIRMGGGSSRHAERVRSMRRELRRKLTSKSMAQVDSSVLAISAVRPHWGWPIVPRIIYIDIKFGMSVGGGRYGA